MKNQNKLLDFDKFISIIEDLKELDTIDKNDVYKSRNESEKLVEAFKKAIDPYQEQPELLDQYLLQLIDKLTAPIPSNISSNISSNRYHTTFKFLYQLIKVTGFKVIVSKFPHEANKLPLVVKLLCEEDLNDKYNWQTRYVLTVWLSILVLTPFDLKKFDQSISDKIYSTLMKGLLTYGSSQQVSAFCLARLFSRPDMVDSENLNLFFKSALEAIANNLNDIPLIGYLQTLCYMFDFFPRSEMKKRCNDILDYVLKLDIEKVNCNHLLIKLVQRVGLALQASEHLESILSILFVAAQNRQTKIRWSAAKGIARLASKISREQASEVISMVLEKFFDELSNELAWHGGCLTLAEMSRHGLILEEKLSEVIEVVSKAIIYDRIKGASPVGAYVREGACYVCWAMARTHGDNLLKPYVSSISINLLLTMLFDRELQCRRAASATFQELIGRQGTSNDEEINILTNVDYQSVGQRQFSYLHLALQVASYGEKYSRPFVDHLLEKKIGHWDIEIRRLASDSLSALMLHSEPSYIRETVLPTILKLVDSVDNNVKHGAILALAKVIRGLVPLQFGFNQELVDCVSKIVEKCEVQLKSKQQAPNFIEAISFIISSAEIAKFNFNTESESLKQWEEISFTALDSDNASLRDIGAEALLTLYRTYFRENKTQQDRILTTLNKSINVLNESSRCGALKALAKLGKAIEDNSKTQGIKTDADTVDIILTSLTSYIAKDTHEKSHDIVFAQAKAEACESFVNFIKSLDKSQLIISSKFIKAGYESLLEKSEDYTFDKRGDIGVIVRRASIKSLQELTSYLLSVNYKSIFEPHLVIRIIARTLQQAVSYHNSTRESAAIAFYKLIESELPEESIPHKSKILNLFSKYNVNDVFSWRDDSTPIFVNLLAYREYSVDLWTGLLPSVGQVSDLCAKQFRDALSHYILSLECSDSEQVFESFLTTLERKDMPDRLFTSGLIVTDYLLTEGLMNDMSVEFQKRLAKLCASSLTAKSNPKRLSSLARVLCSMLQFSGVQRDCLKICLELLGNGYPKVRADTAELLYQSILTYQDGLCSVDELDLDTAMDLLSQTNWREPLEKVRRIRDKISTCLLI